MFDDKILINGIFGESLSGDKYEVTNPANAEVIGSVPLCSVEDLELAVGAADAAFVKWSRLTPFKRGELLRTASKNITDNKKEIALRLSMEQGKPLLEAIGEVQKGADILRYYAEEGERVYGRIIANADEGIESRVTYQPVGVCGAISPWNYPIELLAWKLGAALAAGNTIVCKMPYETPLSTLMFIKVVQASGFEAGVINAITGMGSLLGKAMAEHRKIKKLAFTGSTAVGKTVMSNSVDSLKKLSLELGGSLPMIVAADCDLDQAVKGAVRRSFRNMGQICIAINRIYVERSIYEKFLTDFKAQTEKLTIGHGYKEDVDLGPMCTQKGLQKVEAHVLDALNKGARLITGGAAPEGLSGGNFYKPTILADVNHQMMIMSEETFGPAVGVMPVDTIDEAITLANDSIYGLAAICYTKSLSTANRAEKELDAGNVAINNVDAGVINAPYGGWKDSGLGHEHGPEGLYEYLRVKHTRIASK